MKYEISPAQQEILTHLNLPDQHSTAWGVPILDNNRFHELIAAPPNGALYRPDQQQIAFEWLDPQTGGVAVVFDESTVPTSHREQFSRAPIRNSQLKYIPQFEGLTIGEAPGGDRLSMRKNLGLVVVAQANTASVIQLPGIDDYVSAYQIMNYGQAPIIACDLSHHDYAPPSIFLEMVKGGRWPYDLHFFIDHAPALIVGGTALSHALRSIASLHSPQLPRSSIGQLTEQVDQSASLPFQMNMATFRVKNYAQTADPRALSYSQAIPQSVCRIFNTLAAQELGVQLPEK